MIKFANFLNLVLVATASTDFDSAQLAGFTLRSPDYMEGQPSVEDYEFEVRPEAIQQINDRLLSQGNEPMTTQQEIAVMDHLDVLLQEPEFNSLGEERDLGRWSKLLSQIWKVLVEISNTPVEEDDSGSSDDTAQGKKKKNQAWEWEDSITVSKQKKKKNWKYDFSANIKFEFSYFNKRGRHFLGCYEKRSKKQYGFSPFLILRGNRKCENYNNTDDSPVQDQNDYGLPPRECKKPEVEPYSKKYLELYGKNNNCLRRDDYDYWFGIYASVSYSSQKTSSVQFSRSFSSSKKFAAAPSSMKIEQSPTSSSAENESDVYCMNDQMQCDSKKCIYAPKECGPKRKIDMNGKGNFLQAEVTKKEESIANEGTLKPKPVYELYILLTDIVVAIAGVIFYFLNRKISGGKVENVRHSSIQDANQRANSTEQEENPFAIVKDDKKLSKFMLLNSRIYGHLSNQNSHLFSKLLGVLFEISVIYFAAGVFVSACGAFEGMWHMVCIFISMRVIKLLQFLGDKLSALLFKKAVNKVMVRSVMSTIVHLFSVFFFQMAVIGFIRESSYADVKLWGILVLLTAVFELLLWDMALFGGIQYCKSKGIKKQSAPQNKEEFATGAQITKNME